MSIERAIIQASQNQDTIPKDLILGFSSTQFISDQITTQYIRKTTEPISMHEVDIMVKKVEKESFERVRWQAKNVYWIIHDDLRLVSSTITAIEIDGKSVSNPIGFSGSRVRLSILNIFAPASEFNIVRSVASHTGHSIISLIPIPLIYPKILEKTDYIDVRACVIDVWLMHTTFLCIQNNTIVALETFPFWTDLLIQALALAYPELTLLQIEHMLSHEQYKDVRAECLDEFLSYLIDTLKGFLRLHAPDFVFDYVFCAGWLFDSTDIVDTLRSLITRDHDRKIHLLTFAQLLDSESDTIVSSGLAEIATELLMVKKDPLVRILRYVLYNYE